MVLGGTTSIFLSLSLSLTIRAQDVNLRRRHGSDERFLQACSAMPTGEYFHILSENSGLGLSVSGGSTSSGANVIQSFSEPSDEDNWKFVPTSNGYYRVVAEHSELSLGGRQQSVSHVRKLIVCFPQL